MRDPETGGNEVAEDMTYKEWVKKKESENPESWNLYTKKVRNLSADKKQYHEYRSVLGNKAPKSIDEFQNLKYTKIDKWSALKIAKRQTVFVENAPCITTPKKFTEYFLKEGAKHASQFFDVGYTSDNPLQLRYDIAKQFETHKATSTTDERGKERLVLYMYLGVDKKKRFKTVWIKDNENAKPRILTAYRKGE